MKASQTGTDGQMDGSEGPERPLRETQRLTTGTENSQPLAKNVRARCKSTHRHRGHDHNHRQCVCRLTRTQEAHRGHQLKNLQAQARVLLSTSGGLAYYGLPLLNVRAQKHQHTHAHSVHRVPLSMGTPCCLQTNN